MFRLQTLCLSLYVVFSSASYLDVSKLIYPEKFSEHILNLTRGDVEISQKCLSVLRQYGEDLNNGKSWAIKMFDAGGKIPPGILSGNRGDMGVFDECMAISNPTTNNTIYGKYCLAKLKLSLKSVNKTVHNKERPQFSNFINLNASLEEFLTLTIGTCFPHECSAADIQELYFAAFGIKFVHQEETCQSKVTEPKLDGLAIAAICFLAIICAIMIISTAYDVFIFYTSRKPTPLLVAFSIYSNGKKLLQMSNNPNQISCLYGLRLFSMMWIILGHRYKSSLSEVLSFNILYIAEWKERGTTSFMKGVEVSVDTFFVLSGLVVSYAFMHAVKKGKKFNFSLFYIHRFLRLTPAFAAIIFINASLVKHLGSGPQWPHKIGTILEQPCKDYWWSALLYIQNYVNPNYMCVNQTWYLAVDTQLYVLSPLLLLLFLNWPKTKPFLLSILIVGATLIRFFVAWFREYTAIAQLDPDRHLEYMKEVYFSTQCRATPWLVGLAAGYVLYEFKSIKLTNYMSKKKLKMLNLILWLVSLTVLSACDLGSYAMKPDTSRISHSMFIGFVPLGWSLAISFIILSCYFGYGGPVNWILSNPMMEVLSKFTYSMYLTHNLAIALNLYSLRTNMFFSDAYMLLIFWGDFMLTLALSIFWVLAFESPIIVLEKYLFSRKSEQRS